LLFFDILTVVKTSFSSVPPIICLKLKEDQGYHIIWIYL